MLNPETKEKIRQATFDCLARGNKLFGSSVMLSQILFQSLTTVYGKAGYKVDPVSNRPKYFVKYSQEMCENDPDHIIKDTVPHEVAHVIAMWLKINKKRYGDDGHGQGWKAICKALGGDPEQQTHTYKPIIGKQPRFEWETDAGTTVYLTQAENDKIEKEYKVLRDPDGNRITRFIRQVK